MGRSSTRAAGRMWSGLATFLYLVVLLTAPADAETGGWTGSPGCRSCHEKFYGKWVTSHHGQAMQPYTADFARTRLTPMIGEIAVGPFRYRAEIEPDAGFVRERGAGGEKQYRITYVLGGKNVCYFLTPLERGKLQTLPVAYDLRRREWFDTAASATRHFPDVTDEKLHWTEPPYTFNTSCFGCHVSQLHKNYDSATDTYETRWAEPGINCETCHGAGADHVRTCTAARDNAPPADLKIIVTTTMTHEQRNDLCASCHAKLQPLSASFPPGERYFDHFGLTTLEHPDFYPDGRDLGENYTFTSWRMSPCAKSGSIDCVHCHTPSGRFRFPDKPNAACLPCHDQQVKDAAAHSRHQADSTGAQCIACHMPRTEFARMTRSDHSMLPPAPAATLAFQSPNACTLCHTDKDAAWADAAVHRWRTRDYQTPILYRGRLVEAARKHDWSRLPDILAYITGDRRDEIVATSLIRLLDGCDDNRKWPALQRAMRDASPLVRAAAAAALGADLTHENTRAALLPALTDSYRLVRIAAASALAPYPRTRLDLTDAQRLDRASREYETMLASQPDNSVSQFNLGNYHHDRGQLREALAAYERSWTLEPRATMARVNASTVYAQLGQPDKAEDCLRRALTFEPTNAAADFNLGLLVAEQGNRTEAEALLRAALAADPTLAAAAYNLAVLIAEHQPSEAIALCRQAATLRPAEPRYGYTLAFYQRQQGDVPAATATLQALLQRHPAHLDSVMLLADVYEQQQRRHEAEAVVRQALATDTLSPQERSVLQTRLDALQPATSR